MCVPELPRAWERARPNESFRGTDEDIDWLDSLVGHGVDPRDAPSALVARQWCCQRGRLVVSLERRGARGVCRLVAMVSATALDSFDARPAARTRRLMAAAFITCAISHDAERVLVRACDHDVRPLDHQDGTRTAVGASARDDPPLAHLVRVWQLQLARLLSDSRDSSVVRVDHMRSSAVLVRELLLVVCRCESC